MPPTKQTTIDLCGPLLTKEQLASRYGVSISCVDKWIRKRRIPLYRLSRRCVRFDAFKCDAIIAATEVVAVPQRRKAAVAPCTEIQLMLPMELPTKRGRRLAVGVLR